MFQYHVGPELAGKCPTATDPLVRGPISTSARDRCKIAVVAEKGARDEVREGRPLIGTTGQYTRRHLRRAGIDPFDVYLTNTVHYFNNPDANPTDEDVIREQPRIVRELASLSNLKCIIALGAHAMHSLTNFHLDGILKRRGSRLPTILGVPMIPTLHPSFYVNGEWRYRSVVQFDFNRAVADALNPGRTKRQKRDYYIKPSFLDALDWLNHLDAGERAINFDHGPMLEFDIESVQDFRGRWYVSQIAFANNASEGFCIPFMHTDRSPWWTPRQEFLIRRRIAILLDHENWTYGTQNGLYDCWVLRTEGIRTPHMARGFDTMLAHKYLAPDLPHDLAFIDSIYTDEPYYKDESGRNAKLPPSDEQFQIYNCKDACTQLQSAVAIRNDLSEIGMLSFFYEHVQSQWPIVHDDLQVGGMRIDSIGLLSIRDRLDSEVLDATNRLTDLIGWTPNTRSPLDMAKLFTQFNIPYLTTNKGLARRGEEVLLDYGNRYPHFAPIVHTMLEITSRETLKSNFLSMALDEKGFYHPTWKLFGTKTFRLACEGADEGGPQVLNTPYSLRHIFIPDDPELGEFTKADLKQAEKMIVVYDSQDHSLLPAFKLGKDVHRVVGTWLYLDWKPSDGLPPDELIAQIEKFCDSCLARGDKECTHSRRFISKQSNHAFDYLMGIKKFVLEIMPPSGHFLTMSQGRAIRDKVVTPALARWQSQVAEDCHRSLWFTNLFGMRREFYGIPSNDLYREILAWKASSVVSCITAQAMRRFRLWTRDREHIRIVHQGYDALLISHPRSERERVTELLSKAFYHPLIAHGREFNIPAEFEYGPNWAMKKLQPKVSNTMIASAGE